VVAERIAPHRPLWLPGAAPRGGRFMLPRASAADGRGAGRAGEADPAERLSSEIARTRSLSAQKVLGIDELAQAEGEASTADASAEAIPEMLQAGDALIEVFPPGDREPLPVPTGWGTAVRQAIEGVLDAPERDAHCLGGADEGHSPQDLSVEPPLVSTGARAVDEAFGLVEVER